MRIGLGYDLHKLVEGLPLIIGGVIIPYEKGLLGHSDADVLIHAIIDSLLGAANLGDIGKHFPDTDVKYKNANSISLLTHTANLIKNNGYRIVNIDSNIIIQAPKMAPHISDMRKNIASALEIDVYAVSIKAKTNENMDSMGKGESVSAQAICLLERFE